MQRFLILLILCANLAGCMSVTVYCVADHGSTVSCTTLQDKPVQASPYVRTTGEDVGKAIGAATGGTSVLETIKEKISELRNRQGD